MLVIASLFLKYFSTITTKIIWLVIATDYGKASLFYKPLLRLGIRWRWIRAKLYGSTALPKSHHELHNIDLVY